MPKTEPLGSSVMPLGKKTFASNKNFVDCQFISESEVPVSPLNTLLTPINTRGLFF